MIKRIALLVVIFILSLAAPVWAAEAGSGVIEGRLVNGTAGGSSVADQVITLKTYLNDAEKSSATTKTDTEGRFVFAGLVTTETNNSYDVTVIFQEADYVSERLSFKLLPLKGTTLTRRSKASLLPVSISSLTAGGIISWKGKLPSKLSNLAFSKANRVDESITSCLCKFGSLPARS